MNLRDIQNARERIRPYIRKTPLIPSPFLSEAVEGKIFLKLENLQDIGSFKIRGAVCRLLGLNKEEREKGVLTASAGNHGQGLGMAAQLLGVKATVVVPENTPRTKLEGMKRLGVKLLVHGQSYSEAEEHGRKLEKETGMCFVSPYNDPDVITGQGTIALEILEDLPRTQNIVVPVGGGGIISGIALAAKGLNPQIDILGVQADSSPVFTESLKAGHIVHPQLEETIAEGVHGHVEEDAITFPIIRDHVDEMLLVSEEEIKAAVLLFLKHHGMVAEGAGAVGLAAVLRYPELFRGKTTVVVVTGRNMDLALLKEILGKG